MTRVIIAIMVILMGITTYFNLHNHVYYYSPEQTYNNIFKEKENISLKIMTYNIQYGKGIDGLQDLSRIANKIEKSNADIIALQEVETFSYRSKFKNQTQWLASELNMYAVYSPALVIGFYQYGNAILSKYPITSYKSIKVTSKREPRNILIANIDICNKSLFFISTHLGLSTEERIKHVNQILENTKHKRPTIIAGDWNSTSDRQEVQLIKQFFNDSYKIAGNNKGYTFPGDLPQARIDYIFTSKDIEIIDSRIIKTKVSDHLPVITNVVLF